MKGGLACEHVRGCSANSNVILSPKPPTGRYRGSMRGEREEMVTPDVRHRSLPRRATKSNAIRFGRKRHAPLAVELHVLRQRLRIVDAIVVG